MSARRRAAALLVSALLAAVWARPARAASCSFVAVSGVSFGSYDVFDAAATDSAGSVSYTCNGGATVTMALSIGSAPSYSPRQMLRMGGGGVLDYNLYLDAGRSTIWGDGTGMTGQYGPNMPADGATVVVPIFGRIPAGEDAVIGVYTDTITVTINF